jgi:uncharacterized iron-regulated protein
MKTYTALFLLLLIYIPSNGQVTEKNYRIYSVQLAKEVTLDDIAVDMNNYDVLFFGEEHNDSAAHYLESKMLEALYQKFGSAVTLSMEMFDRDVQYIVKEYLADAIREKTFIKDARAWKNYRDYRPMIEFAKTYHLDLICANAPTRYSNLAGRKGQSALMELPEESKKYFAPLPYDTAEGKYYEKLMAVTHDAPAPNDTAKKPTVMIPTNSFSMVMAQSLWDATMAYSIARYFSEHPGNKIFQVNGRFHSDEGFAVVTQLKKYSPEIKTLIISCGSDDSFTSGSIDWNKFSHLGDYIIITDPKLPKAFDE